MYATLVRLGLSSLHGKRGVATPVEVRSALGPCHHANARLQDLELEYQPESIRQSGLTGLVSWEDVTNPSKDGDDGQSQSQQHAAIRIRFGH